MNQLIFILFIVLLVGMTKLKLSLKMCRYMFFGIYHLYIKTTNVNNNNLLKKKLKEGCKKVLNSTNIYPIIKGKIIEQPQIIISNHHSFIDPLVLKYINQNFMTIAKHDSKKEFIFSKMLEEFMIRWSTILYKRGDKKSGSIVRKLIKYYILYKKKSILLFPEGKTYPDGPPQKFFPGSFEVAFQNKIPIQPVVIKYSQDISWTDLCEKPKPWQLDIYKNVEKLLNTKTIAYVDILEPVYPNQFNNVDDFMKYIRIKMIKSWTNLFYKVNK